MKILVVATTSLCHDGLTSVLIKISRIAAEQHHVSFALGEPADQEILDKLRETGEVYELPSRKHKLPVYCKALSRIVREGHFRAVHIHGNSATMAFDLLAAALGGADVRISHIHNCKKQLILKQLTLGSLMNALVTVPVACSQGSGQKMYRKDFFVITNGVDCKRFQFDPAVRKAVRNRMELEKAFLVGHLGRFTTQKNQIRLVQIFNKVLNSYSNARLLMIGEGEESDRCKEEVKKLGIQNHVIFVDYTECPEEYYSAMDVFVMPSLFEGLPLAGVEAQANGLPCVFSDTITEEVKLLEQSVFVSLNASDDEWAKTILNCSPADRHIAAELVKKSGFDEEIIREQVLRLYE